MGWIDQKRQYRRYKHRVAQLPGSYRTAVAGIERYLYQLGGMSDGDSILTMLDDLATLFEQAAADGTSVRAVVGDDPVEFMETFLSNYPSGNWIVRERTRLVKAIDRAEAEGASAGTEGGAS
jgi:DNA-binding ferritin-like protein (Dps family)